MYIYRLSFHRFTTKVIATNLHIKGQTKAWIHSSEKSTQPNVGTKSNEMGAILYASIMPYAQRMMITGFAQQQNWSKRTTELHHRGIDSMPPLARSCKGSIWLGFFKIHGINVLGGPNIPTNKQIVPTNRRPIPDMVKNPFPAPEELEAHGAVSTITNIQLPPTFNAMDLELMQVKLLFVYISAGPSL